MSAIMTPRERTVELLTESIYDNPVLVKDFRTRLRGAKGFVIMGGYALLLAVVMLIAYYFMYMDYSNASGSRLMNAKIGLDLFMVLSWAQVIMLTIVLPSISSGALTHEIEKKTIEMLVLTKLSAGKIVIGKQMAGFAYASMMLVCSLPLSGICLMMGGISPAEIAITYALLLAWAFLLTCGSVFWSSLYNKSATASGNSIGLAFLYFLFTASFGGPLVMMSRYSSSSSYPLHPMSLLNPAWAPFGALRYSEICGISIPTASIAFLFHVAVGILLLMVASTHVRYHKVERALPIRLLFLGITVFTAWISAGSINGYSYHNPGNISLDMLSGLATSILIGTLLSIAIFATGPINKRPNESFLGYALDWRRTFKTDLGGAICFLLLYTIVNYGTHGLTLYWAYARSSTQSNVQFWAAYWMIGIAMLAMVFGFSAVAVLASSLVKLRRNAVGLLMLFVIVMFAGYGIVLINFNNYSTGGQSPILHLAALWPMTPILAATDEWNTGMPIIYWVKDYAWAVTGLVYALMGWRALELASKAFARFGGVQEE